MIYYKIKMFHVLLFLLNQFQYNLYLSWTLKVHPWNRQSSDVHGDAPVQVQRPYNEQEPPTNNRPAKGKTVVTRECSPILFRNMYDFKSVYYFFKENLLVFQETPL